MGIASVRVFLPGKYSRPYLFDVLPDGVLDLRVQVRVLLDEFRGEPLEHPQHVVDYQDLAVTVHTAADADRRYGEGFCDRFRQGCGHAFEDYGEGPRLLQDCLLYTSPSPRDRG